MRSFGLVISAAVLFGAAALAPARSQSVPPRPNLPASPVAPMLPPAVPEAKPETHPPEAPAAAAHGPDLLVPVNAADIEGMTIYTTDSFAALLAGLIGEAVPVSRIDAARLAIVNRYRDDGYTLTAVSAVVEADGRVRLRVTEGRIAEVRLDGDIGSAGVQVLRFLARLTEPRVIDTATLERALLLAGDVPGVNLRAILRPSTDEPGALTLVAQVSREAVTGQVTSDNRAFANVGPEQALAVLDVNSLSEFGEHTQLQLYRTFNGSQIFGNFSVDSFIGSDGLRIRLYAGTGLSKPTGTFRSINYLGRTDLFGAEVSYPLVRSRRQTLNVLGAFDVIEATIAENGVQSSADSLRVARVGVDYAVADQVFGDTRNAVNVVIVRLSQGISALGATPFGAALAGRSEQQPAFRKASVDITRTQTLFQPWDGASVAVMGVVAGQYTRDVLPSAEKFFLGGSRLTRGFYYGQVTGDRAVTATAEVQFNTVGEFNWWGGTTEVSTQFYAFYDWAQTWENLPEDHGRRLRSAGLGVRLIPAPRLELDIEVARRLTRYPTGSGPGIAALPASAFYWRLLARF